MRTSLRVKLISNGCTVVSSRLRAKSSPSRRGVSLRKRLLIGFRDSPGRGSRCGARPAARGVENRAGCRREALSKNVRQRRCRLARLEDRDHRIIGMPVVAERRRPAAAPSATVRSRYGRKIAKSPFARASAQAAPASVALLGLRRAAGRRGCARDGRCASTASAARRPGRMDRSPFRQRRLDRVAHGGGEDHRRARCPSAWRSGGRAFPPRPAASWCGRPRPAAFTAQSTSLSRPTSVVQIAHAAPPAPTPPSFRWHATVRPVPGLGQARHLGPAARPGEGTARMEGAARRRVDRRRDLALDRPGTARVRCPASGPRRTAPAYRGARGRHRALRRRPVRPRGPDT